MYEWMAKSKANAAIVFSPPLKFDIGCKLIRFVRKTKTLHW